MARHIWMGLVFAAFALAASAQQPITHNALPIAPPKGIPFGWKQMPGAALAISTGVDGTVWVIGNEPGAGGHTIYKWNGASWTRVAGYAERIAGGGPSGDAYGVNSSNQIHRYSYGQSVLVQAPPATDVAAGSDGSLWMIGAEKASDRSVYRLGANGWEKMPGAAVRIAAGDSAHVFIVNSAHEIYQWGKSSWTRIPGSQAIDIAIGSHGELYSLDPKGQIYQWIDHIPVAVSSYHLAFVPPKAGAVPNPLDMRGVLGDSTAITGPLKAITVDADGNPWGVNQGNLIWKSSHVTRAALDKWVNKYAPVAYFNQGEKYFPTSAEGYMSIAQPAGDGLALRDTSEHAKAGNLSIARPYVNAKVGITTTDLQYWFLYAYNGPGTAYWRYLKVVDFKNPGDSGRYADIGDTLLTPCGQHEGDWEHLTIRVDNSNGEMIAGYLAQHDAGVWFTPDQVNMTGGRVTVYPSKFGHASYWTAARDYSHFISAGVFEFRLLNDTEHAGMRWDTRSNGGPMLMAVQGAPQISVASPSWMQYKGRWGRVYERGVAAARTNLESNLGSVGGKVADLGVVQLADFVMDKAGIKDECEQEFGPYPPWAKDSWTGQDN